jgi:hypothetical protein
MEQYFPSTLEKNMVSYARKNGLTKMVEFGAALVLLLLLCAGISANATNIPVFPTGPVYSVPGLIWGNNSATGIGTNNIFFFTPLNANETMCAYVYNNNPTNSHPLTVQIFFTADPGSTTPNTSWFAAYTNSSAIAIASPGAPSISGVSLSGAAQIAILIVNSGSLAGSPDTANLIITQTAPGGNCGVLANGATGLSSTIPFQAISDGNSTSYAFSATATNPAANALLIGAIQPANSGKTIYLDKVYISTTAAGTFNVNSTSTTGTTCTAASPGNSKSGPGTTLPTGQYTSGGCAASPTVTSVLLSLPIPANTLTVIDLRGYSVQFTPGGTNGIDVTTLAAITGTTTLSLQTSEK